MRPDKKLARLQRELDRVTEAVTAAAIIDVSALERAAKESATMVRMSAARAHDSIGIRVVRKHNGVRVTLTGRSAAKYRALMERDLAQRMPEATAEIRTQITRKIK